MKKYILLLFMITGFMQSQTLQNPTFGNTTTNTLKIKTPATVTSVNFLPAFDADGFTVSKITPANLPVSTAMQTALDGKVTANSPITPGTNTKLTYNADGLVTSGTGLIASDIPNILESQVTGLVSDLALKADDALVIHQNATPETKIGGFTSGGVNMVHPSDNWIAMGTSVTFGGAYTTPMSLQLGLIVTNLGVSGSTSANLASQYASIPTLNSGNQDSYRLISIEHGINDAATAVPLATFRANIEAAIANIKGKNWPNNKILIINGNYCSSAPLIPVQQVYADEAILIAKEQGVQYADIYNYTKNNGGSSLLADGVHPTTAGGEVYARGVIASMQGGGEFTNALSVVNGVVMGNFKSYSDSYVNGLTIGKGASGVVNNTASGFEVIFSNTTGVRNTGVGYQALKFTTSGSNNTATGYRSLYSNVGGSDNAGYGWQSLLTNTSGTKNTGSGVNSLALNTTGSENTATGYQSLISNTSGVKNTGSGVSSLYSNTTGVENTGVGYQAFLSLNSGSNNTAIGSNAGRFFLDSSNILTTSNNSLFLGYGSKALSNNSSNEIVIGYNAVGLGTGTTVIGNSSITFGRFYGNFLLGNSTNTGEQLQVTGTAKITGVATLSVSPIISSETANTIASFDASKNLKSLPLATYPSLTELSYGKGVTSAIQPQIDSKEPTITAGTTAQYRRGDKTWQDLNSEISIQKIVDNANRYGELDEGNSYIYALLGSANNRIFKAKTGDATNSGEIYSSNNEVLLRGEISGVSTGVFQVFNGLSKITQTSASGTTTLGLIPATVNTTINNPANSVAGTYIYQMQPKEYTVSTLPTPTGSDSRFAIVTDALAPVYLSILIGGGSVVTPAFYNGTNWVSH